ncbi:MFS transporter [Phytomonospora sp. NPDC050363]|uniref:MFS transporter n=1 Tax=Phytomonospora sp. NPDC050363 TaxID=3155642 RepID=UPI0033E866DE
MNRRRSSLALLCVANFMVILDAQIVLLAVPSITAGLGSGPAGAQWVLSGYMLAFGGLLLLGGRTADTFGRRRVFMAGTAVFLLSSLLCGLAWSLPVLVAARVGQGVSAAMMTPSALALLMAAFPEGRDRNRALAVWGSTGAFGATAALLIGGGLTGLFGWEAIFLLNVPVALLMIVGAARLLPADGPSGVRRSFDVAGALTSTGALTALIWAVTGAPAAGWASPATLVPLTAGVVLAAAFLVVESRAADPLVPLRLFAGRAFSGGNLLTLAVGLTAFGTSFAVSEYAQRTLGYTPLIFGLATAVLPLAAVGGSSIGQAAVTRAGSRPVGSAGMALMAAGAVWLWVAPTAGDFVTGLLPALALFGTGLGATSVASASAALSGVAPADAGVASGLNTAAFQIGGALGVAAAASVMASDVDAPVTGFAAATACALFGLAVAAFALPGTKRSLARSGARG